MVKKKIIKVVSYGLGAIVLLILMVSLVTATSERQAGNQSAGTAQGTGSSQAGSACAQTYVVQRDDTLSSIALKYLGNLFAYNLIFQATNAVAGTDGFTPIHDPNIIEPGQVLCIPASPVAGSARAGIVVTGTGQITLTGSIPADPSYNLTPEQGVLLVDNRADNDIIFDLTRPLPGSAWIAPDRLQPFIVPAGLQGYMAHHPIGAFSIAPGEVQVAAGHITRLVCFKEVCQLESLVQPSPESQLPSSQRPTNQPVVVGQPPPPPPDKDNIDNNNIDNASNGNDNNGNDNNGNDNNGNDNNGNDNNGNDNTDNNNDNTDNNNDNG